MSNTTRRTRTTSPAHGGRTSPASPARMALDTNGDRAQEVRRRAAVALRAGGMSQQQIAETLGYSLGTIRNDLKTGGG